MAETDDDALVQPVEPALYQDAPGRAALGQQTRHEWRKQILEELGGEGVDVELTESLLDRAIDDALQLWAKYKPFLAWFPFLIGAQETQVITFFQKEGGPTADPNGCPYAFVNRVLDVKFQDMDRRSLGARSGFFSGYYLRWGAQGPRLFFQLAMAERTYERLTGSRPDWQWDAGTRTLFITSPTRDVKAMVLTSRPRLLDEIRTDHETDFRQAALAAAKRILARILGARGPIPGPAGPIVTDAAELRQEGKEEWNEVRDRLSRALTAYPPMSYVG